MYKIVSKRELAPKIKLFEVEVPRIAGRIKPGQFLVLRLKEEGERFPLTIVAADGARGTVKFAFHEVGKTTQKLGTFEVGDCIMDVVGPLGNPSDIKKFGRVLCVGGGVLAAPMHFVASALKRAGNDLIVVLGARNKDLLIFEDELKALSGRFYLFTDDGSKGYAGLGFLEDILKKEKIDHAVAMGPVIMEKTVSEMTSPYNIKTMVTLTPIMVDGMGMCGCCRVGISGKTKFACYDGPEFDGHTVDWELLVARMRLYLAEERVASLFYGRLPECTCKAK